MPWESKNCRLPIFICSTDFILTYPLPNGKAVKLLADENIYWGNQIERPDSERCYGLAADDRFLLICEYGCAGSNPEILLYKKRK